MASLVYFVLIGGVFALPLIFWPWAKIPYELPKVWFVSRWVEILVLLPLFAKLRINKVKTLGLVLLLAWIVVAVAASFLGVDTNKSLLGNFYRQDGLITFFHLTGFALFIALFWQEKWRDYLVWAAVLGNTLSCLTIFLVPAWPDGSLGGVFGQPNFMAGYILVTLPFSFWLIAESSTRKKLFLLFLIVIQIIAIFLTQSLVSTLGVIVLILLWFCLVKKRITYILIALVLALACSLGVIYFWWTDLHSKELVANPTLIVAESRERIYTKVFLGALRKPWLGYGVANVDYAFEAVDWPIKIDHDVYVDKAHLALLEVFATTGIVGLCIYTLLVVYVGSNLFKKAQGKKTTWDYSLFVVFVLYLFHTQTNVTSISEEVVFWFLVGLALINPKKV